MEGMKKWSGLFLLIWVAGQVRGQGEIITSPPFTDWGDWGAFERCPNGTFAQGFQLKTEPYRGALIDDSAGNGLRLICGSPIDSAAPTITSSEGAWGEWGKKFSCYPGYVYGFQLKVEHNGIDDETATNNVRVFCTNREPEDFLEGDGLIFGRWTEERRCASTQALCGLQTQVQKDQGILIDDTSLNNIAALCCDIPEPTSPPTTTTPTTTTPPTTTTTPEPTTPEPTTPEPTTPEPTTPEPTTPEPTTPEPTTPEPTTPEPTTPEPTTPEPTTPEPTTPEPTTPEPTTPEPTTPKLTTEGEA